MNRDREYCIVQWLEKSVEVAVLKLRGHAWQLVDGKQVYTQERSSISSFDAGEYILCSSLSIQKEMENLPLRTSGIQIVLFRTIQHSHEMEVPQADVHVIETFSLPDWLTGASLRSA
jgi:hypothetical protein